MKFLRIFLYVLIAITITKELFPQSKLCFIKTEPLPFVIEPERVPTPEQVITPSNLK